MGDKITKKWIENYFLLFLEKIRRVIAQSGSAVAEWAVLSDNYTIYNNSLEYASLFNCQFQSSWRTVECLARESLFKFETLDFKVSTLLLLSDLQHCHLSVYTFSCSSYLD